MNHIDGLVLQQLTVIGVDSGTFDAVLVSGFYGALFHDITESHHFHMVQFSQGREMLAVGNAAAADDADADFFVCSDSHGYILLERTELLGMRRKKVYIIIIHTFEKNVKIFAKKSAIICLIRTKICPMPETTAGKFQKMLDRAWILVYTAVRYPLSGAGL